MDAKTIFKLSSVSRVDDNAEEGYQRLLNNKRADDIASYLNEGNIIPGSIILSAQNGCNITFNKEQGEIEFKLNSGKLFVIDGQHRLYGASRSEKNILLPVCIFSNLEIKQEVQYFLDINSNQKGVPKTLRIELLKFLSEPDSKEAVLIKLFRDLGEQMDSPLFSKISPTASSPGKISHVPFQSALEPIIEGKILKGFDYDNKKTLILNYLNALEDVLVSLEGSNKRMTNSAFFQAIFKVFEDVCSYSLTYYKNYKTSSFKEILNGINKIDFDKHSGSNQQTIGQMSNELSDLLQIHVTTLEAPNDLL